MAQASAPHVGTRELRSSFNPLRLRQCASANLRTPTHTCNAISFPFKARGKSEQQDPLPRVTVSPKEDDHDLVTFLRNRIPSQSPHTGWGHFISGTSIPSDSSEQAPRLLFLGLFLASLSSAAVADVHSTGRSLGTVTLSSFQLQPGDATSDAAGTATVCLKQCPAQPVPADASGAAPAVNVTQQYDTVQLAGVVAALLVAATALNGVYARAFAELAPEIAAAEMPSELQAIGVSREATTALLHAAAPHAGYRAPGAAYLARTLALEAVRVLAVGEHSATSEELRAVRVLCERTGLRDLSPIAAKAVDGVSA
eukprot:jgi/Ulvmu1/12446/UM009_0098.1